MRALGNETRKMSVCGEVKILLSIQTRMATALIDKNVEVLLIKVSYLCCNRLIVESVMRPLSALLTFLITICKARR